MNKIPKIVHYCWFGEKSLPDEAKKCIDSWRKYLPDYELRLWNEENFNINCNQFVKEAYHNKKYAFVTDYVRLYALYHYGGVYMDTDVEVIKSLDKFLVHESFTSFENEHSIPTGMMAASKNNTWIKDLLSYYDNKSFYLDNGKLYNQPNTVPITKLTLEKYDLKLNNEHQILEGDLNIYPFDYFCAKDWRTGEVKITKNTHTIHHFHGSWVSNKDKIRGKLYYKIKPFLNKIKGK